MRRAIMSANRSAGYVAVVLTSLLLHPANSLSLSASTLGGLNKPARMTADQRVAHVLSRLTFGARPGDFEKVKAMGVEAFINQQLDPDSIENSGVIAKLRKLPTLNMATPVIIDQYTPPKPAVSPSPTMARPEVMNAPEVKTAQNSPNQTQQSATNASTSAMPNGISSRPEDLSKTPAIQASAQTPAPKPTPPPKNPQM